MADRTIHACPDHAHKAFKALMHGDDPLPGDSLVIDSKAGCQYCQEAK